VSRSRSQAWLILALVANFAALGLFAWRGRPAQAQVSPGGPHPLQPPRVLTETSASASTTPQPIEVQALDATHFVVVTREPRLTTRIDQDGPWQNMLLTVVTHYSVQNGHLLPVEHVHVPAGYRTLEP
jgi:hypothetical protein